TPALTGNDQSYRGRFSYDGDLYGLSLDHLFVGDDFNPEVGFLRRDAFRQSGVTARFSPRPASIEAIRQFTLQGDVDYLTSTRTGWVESREIEGTFRIEFENSDNFSASLADTYELLEEPFRIAEDVTIVPGRYSYRDVLLGYSLGPQRPF